MIRNLLTYATDIPRALASGAGFHALDLALSALASVRPTRTVAREDYMRRSYLFGRVGKGFPTGTKATLGGLDATAYLHRISTPDAGLAHHSHPWQWAISVVIAGGYTEELVGPDGCISTVERGPGSVGVLSANTYHRISALHERHAWTLFIAGPRTPDRAWYFRRLDGSIVHEAVYHANLEEEHRREAAFVDPSRIDGLATGMVPESLLQLASRIRDEFNLAPVRSDVAAKPWGAIGWTLNQLSTRLTSVRTEPHPVAESARADVLDIQRTMAAVLRAPSGAPALTPDEIREAMLAKYAEWERLGMVASIKYEGDAIEVERDERHPSMVRVTLPREWMDADDNIDTSPIVVVDQDGNEKGLPRAVIYYGTDDTADGWWPALEPEPGDTVGLAAPALLTHENFEQAVESMQANDGRGELAPCDPPPACFEHGRCWTHSAEIDDPGAFPECEASGCGAVAEGSVGGVMLCIEHMPESARPYTLPDQASRALEQEVARRTGPSEPVRLCEQPGCTESNVDVIAGHALCVTHALPPCYSLRWSASDLDFGWWQAINENAGMQWRGTMRREKSDAIADAWAHRERKAGGLDG